MAGSRRNVLRRALLVVAKMMREASLVRRVQISLLVLAVLMFMFVVATRGTGWSGVGSSVRPFLPFPAILFWLLAAFERRRKASGGVPDA